MLSSTIPLMSSDVYAADGDILKYITGFSGSWEVAFDSANNRMYVGNVGQNTYSVINTSDNSVSNSSNLGASSTRGIAFDSTNNRMYIISESGSKRVSVINTSNPLVVDSIITLPESSTRHITFDPAGNRMYISHLTTGKISVINTSTNVIDSTITLSSWVGGAAFDSANNRMYFAVYGNNKVAVVDVNSVTAPSQVGTVTITPGTDTTALSWSAPSDGGSSITDYIIQISPDGTTWNVFSDGTSTATTATVTGLPKGTAYHFKVAAVNSVGTGSYSSSGSGTSFDYGASHTFTEATSFDTGTRFQSGTTFKANQDFSGGAMTFGANQVFDAGTKFAASQGFTTAQTFGNSQEFGSGGTFAAANTWGEKADFSAGTQTFNAAQTFGAAAKFAANQDFTNVDHDFSGAAMFFNSGGAFSAGEVMGIGADFSSGVQTFGSGMTFGQATEFANSQDWGANAQTFDKYMHFGESNDFTGKTQTFKEGSSFGAGTTFKDTQTMPLNTIPAFGVMLEAVTCGTDTSAGTCIPNDASKYLAPGEFLTAGQDPAATSNSISSNDKSFAVEGAGLEMSFGTVSGDGTITSDLYDPANIPSSTAVGDTGKVSVSTSNAGSVETIGSVTNISTGTATISGDITITLSYSEANIPAGTAESELTMIHYTGGEWKTESSCTVDTANNKISCTVTSLSPFGVGGSGSSGTSSTSTSGVGGGGNCDSKGFGTGKSLMVYNVDYSIDTHLVTLQAYSTCGTISASIITESGEQVMGLSMEQPLIDDNIVLYSAVLPEGIIDFTISLNNKKNTFDEKYYPHGSDLNQSYTGETRYTSAQQGTSETSGYTSEQHEIIADTVADATTNTVVDTTSEIIDTVILPDVDTLVADKISETTLPIESVANEKITLSVESIITSTVESAQESANAPAPQYIPEPTAEYVEEPVTSSQKDPTSTCGEGTQLVNGFCKVIQKDVTPWWQFW